MIIRKCIHWAVGLAAALVWARLPAQDAYLARQKEIMASDFTKRPVASIPASGKRIRVIIDSDTGSEIDDQWAISLALLAPERFKIEGFVAANFFRGGPGSIRLSYDEIERVLAKAGMQGKIPVFLGADPMRYAYGPSESAGVDFIVRKALESTPDDRLWIVGLGAATDLASAYLKAPQIADRAVFFWHGRTKWPKSCWNFNVFGDRYAAALLFQAPIAFVLFDTGTNLTCSMEESERNVRPYGALGAYLHDYRKTRPGFMRPDKGFFDLGDIASLLDPASATWEVTDAPEVGPDLAYAFTGHHGQILRCSAINRDRAFDLLFKRLQAAYPAGH